MLGVQCRLPTTQTPAHAPKSMSTMVGLLLSLSESRLAFSGFTSPCT